MLNEIMAQQECLSPDIKRPGRPSIRENLEAREHHLEQQLTEVKAAIKFLDENPNFNTGFDLLAKALR